MGYRKVGTLEQIWYIIKARLKMRKKPTMDLTAIKFDEANKNLLKPQSMTDEECSSLWVYTDGKECISCWKLSFKQRLSALLFGRIWLSVLSGKTQPPVWLGCGKTIFIKEDKTNG